MRAIKLSHGMVFLEIDGISIRVTPDGDVGLSPTLYDTLEWEMASTPPNRWEYLTEGDVRSLEGGIYEKAVALACSIKDQLDV